MLQDDATPRHRARAANDRAAWLTVAVFLAGFGGMIWAIGSAIDLF